MEWGVPLTPLSPLLEGWLELCRTPPRPRGSDGPRFPQAPSALDSCSPSDRAGPTPTPSRVSAGAGGKLAPKAPKPGRSKRPTQASGPVLLRPPGTPGRGGHPPPVRPPLKARSLGGAPLKARSLRCPGAAHLGCPALLRGQLPEGTRTAQLLNTRPCHTAASGSPHGQPRRGCLDFWQLLL